MSPFEAIQKEFLDRLPEQQALFERYVNPQLAKVLRAIGFDQHYVRAEGAYLYNEKGEEYLDAISGYGVFNLGRNHPKIKEALKQAIDANLPNMVQMDAPLLAGMLAEKLLSKIAVKGMDKVFFTNSGTEAVEGAIKFARKSTGRSRILFWEKAFHGLTNGSLSLNGNREFRDGFGDLLPGTQSLPFGDLESLERHLQKEDVAALILELVQGKGINVASNDFYTQAQALCKKHGVLLIIDEVQTGFGRTGKWFAFEHWNLEPDIVCVAKALSGGFVPVGAICYRNWIYEKVYPNMEACMVHSNTFGRNMLAMVAGLATLKVMEEEKIVEHTAEIGDLLISGLARFEEEFEMFKEVRGKGLMIAVEFQEPRSPILKAGWKLISTMHKGLFAQMVVIPLFRDHRILTQVAGHHMDVVRMLPPLTIGKKEVEMILQAYRQVLSECHRFPGSAWKLGKELAQLAYRAR